MSRLQEIREQKEFRIYVRETLGGFAFFLMFGALFLAAATLL